MKKIIIAILIFLPAFAMAQNFINVPIDSLTNLLKQVEISTDLKLNLRQRNDSIENYLFRDDTWFVKVYVNMKNEKTMEGVKIITGPNLVDYITISGPTNLMEGFLNNYLKKCSKNISQSDRYVQTEKWKASIRDYEIINLNGEKWGGSAITIE